ncbi:hypothetical protein, conserved [Trypanosoma brucei gambiense DAL972]|uniref:Pentacotripeptide-repeat region of PRORP domain-containing protein n=2 Tax=Trypanosoma brucei TaxID=5691 RepID=D0A5J6_TRYB9|nr:hypothetical protein, conserved [Trypanosoma brucei gambiense DAL972]RHW67791.1 pentatricopeptide repeat domain containing protein [Trypanosoma brucei equiperdum]CBH16947.1 hypothetical protein, conserved [Trypanosoma brucei gambiense DAL972]|eukprot:XP_011779211.1 hypothetical protein, conserved [Trypanosoma brucei gambiense DAL972]
MRASAMTFRGRMDVKPWMGVGCYPVTPSFIGGMLSVKPAYNHYKMMRPQRPLRAIGTNVTLPPVLYNRLDQIVQIENAIALQRVERQVEMTLSQLALGIRNAEDFLEKHLLHAPVRPSLHMLWFHEDGIRKNQHILSTLGAHHLVPLFSLLAYDVERGKMSLHMAEELYDELMDCSVAQPKVVQRELTNQMVRAYCLHDEFEKALDVVSEMKAKGIRRTFVTYAPIFRMIRSKEDVETHLKLEQFMRDAEGGRLQKLCFIDVPRIFYVFGVFIRYNWAAINSIFTAICTIGALHLFNYGI